MARSAAACASLRCAALPRGGFHDFTIETGGLNIFPRLIAAEHYKQFAGDYTPSGNAELDELLGGGLERGTNALLIGSAGVGKSSLALTYAIAAAERDEHAVFFAFDEGRGTLDARAHPRSSAAKAPRFRPHPVPADRSCRAVAGRVRFGRAAKCRGRRR